MAYDGSEFKDSIEQLYVKKSGQGDAIVTAISGENIITFIKNSFGRSSKATIPASNITSLSDFVAIIHGRLTRDISTLPPITVTERTVTSEKVPLTSPSSSIATETEKGDASSTEKPTTSGKSTQKVFTIPSVSEILTANSTTPTFTTPLLPQTSSLPQPHKLSFAGADRSTDIGVMLASLLGVLGLAGAGFVVYKLVQRCLRNHDEPGYNHYQSSRPNRMSLQNLVRNKSSNVDTRKRSSSHSSDSNQSANNSIYGPPVGSNGMDKPEIILHGVSVDGRRSSSESLESSRSPSLSCSSTTSQSEVILHGISVDSRSSSESPEGSRSPSPSRS